MSSYPGPRQVVIAGTNILMMIVLVSLSMAAFFAEYPRPRALPVRLLGAVGLLSLLGHSLSRLWPFLARRRHP